MVKALVQISTVGDPYANIATERLLMDVVEPDEQILFLWQNSNTIVIGRNQNAYQECKVDEFEKDGGHLARRLSGGGAVYHDTGNLNFTFISPRDAYDVSANMSIICEAVRSFGLDAQCSGRNDVEIDGAKFSGNAFFNTKNACYHHGTLMISVDTNKLARYLQPDPRKLATRGVKSVRSRVVNLHDLNESITVETLKQALLKSFSEYYGVPVAMLAPERLDAALCERERERFASAEWRLGKLQNFDWHLDRRYTWGGIDIQLTEADGVVKDVRVYSDALDVEFIAELAQTFEGVALEASSLVNSLDELTLARPLYETMVRDIQADIAESFGSDDDAA